MFALRSIVLAVGLVCAAMATAGAQAPVTLPPGMTQEQFNSLVDAISNSVTEKLRAEGATSAPAPAAAAPASSKAKAPAPAIVRTPIAEGPGPFAVFFERAGKVVRAIPVLGTHLASIPRLLDQSAPGHPGGGRGTSGFLLLLGLVAVAAVAAEAVLRALMTGLRHRLAGGARPEQGLRSLTHLGLLALLDGLGVFAVWVICNAAIGAWFTGPIGQDKLAAAVLDGIFHWRLYVFLFLIVLRPALPQARLCDATDRDARAMYVRIEAVMLLIILARILGQVLMAIGTPNCRRSLR